MVGHWVRTEKHSLCKGKQHLCNRKHSLCSGKHHMCDRKHSLCSGKHSLCSGKHSICDAKTLERIGVGRGTRDGEDA